MPPASPLPGKGRAHFPLFYLLSAGMIKYFNAAGMIKYFNAGLLIT
jgi:preprotein translocase subunit Sec61beta